MFFKLQDKTINLLGKSVLLTVGMQKKSMEGIPMVVGFLLDVFTLGRIDQLWSLGLQVIYIALIFIFLWMEQIPVERRKFAFFWKYYDFLLQFCFGGLLSAYSIFYFKSASNLLVILFAMILFLLMVLNESKRFHAMKFPIRYVLASLCLVSFTVYLLPILFHWMNWITFILSASVSLFLYLQFVDKSHRNQSWKDQPKRQRAFWGSAVPILFVVLYVFKLIPPVPLSCSEIGIYHNVTKSDGAYILEYTRPWWKFWQKGDQTFVKREGDQVYVFTSVFAPSGLEHKIQIRWEKYEQNSGWQTSDLIPMPIKGGRDEGYRGFAYKQNVSEGKWRVRIQTQEGRELRRLRFDIRNDQDPTSDRIIRSKRS